MLTRLWHTSPELIATAGLMIVVLIGAMVGLLLDPAIVTGAPVWLKPAKFAVSIFIYTVTLAWVFTLLPDWPRTRLVIGRVTAAAMLVEMTIIGGQAWRGTNSHFNTSTPFDAVLFGIMGVVIVIQTLSTIAVAVALWRQRFEDPALGWALRAGMTITIAGALTGGLMARPTASQIALARSGQPMTVSGAHTVGGADGGPGMPGTGWSTAHGDLRVPHFVGLHGLQVLPLIAMLMAGRRLREDTRVRLIMAAALSYFALFAILMVQALRGIPLVAPDAPSLVTLGVWATATLAGVALGLRQPRSRGRAIAIV